MKIKTNFTVSLNVTLTTEEFDDVDELREELRTRSVHSLMDMFVATEAHLVKRDLVIISAEPVMKLYRVPYTLTYKGGVEIEAENEHEAEGTAAMMYDAWSNSQMRLLIEHADDKELEFDDAEETEPLYA
jgi:hypothetical protein